MKSALFFTSLSLALLLQNSCCTPHLNTSGKLSEIGKSYTGFANEVPEKIYLKNSIYYAEVKQQNFSYNAPVIDHTFCPNVGESNYTQNTGNESATQLFYFPLIATSLPLSKDAYILQLKAHKNTLIAERDFDKANARPVPVKNVVAVKRNALAKAALDNDPVITDTTVTTTHHVLKPVTALDAVAVDLPLTVAGGIPLAVGSGLYKGGQWVGSLFSDETKSTETENTTNETTATVNEEESPVEEIVPATPQSAAAAEIGIQVQQVPPAP